MTEKDKATKYSPWGLNNICAMLENLARGLGESAAWVIIIVSLFKVD